MAVRTELRGEGEASIFETEYSCRATGAQSSLRRADLTVLGFTIGASTIRDVQKRFPRTQLGKLAHEEEAERGVCVKNDQGMAVVFATSVMGAPDTLVAVYLAPVALVESSKLSCENVGLPSTAFSSRSGIRVGGTSSELSKAIRSGVPADGTFCAAYEIASSRGPLQISKAERTEGVDSDGSNWLV
jgi:hypothetical protein